MGNNTDKSISRILYDYPPAKEYKRNLSIEAKGEMWYRIEIDKAYLGSAKLDKLLADIMNKKLTTPHEIKNKLDGYGIKHKLYIPYIKDTNVNHIPYIFSFIDPEKTAAITSTLDIMITKEDESDLDEIIFWRNCSKEEDTPLEYDLDVIEEKIKRLSKEYSSNILPISKISIFKLKNTIIWVDPDASIGIDYNITKLEVIPGSTKAFIEYNHGKDSAEVELSQIKIY